MNKKGQMATIGIIISVAIVAIVGLILLQATAQSAGDVTNTYDIVNESFSAVNNTNVYLPYKAIVNPVVWNMTADTVITEGAGNYTITNNVIHDGALTTRISMNMSESIYYLFDAAHTGLWNISGAVQPTTYGDGASRAVTGLIIVFFALAIAAIALYPIYQGELKNILAGK